MTKMWQEILEQPRAVESCISYNKAVVKDLIRAIELKKIRSVVIAARGTSDHVAIYAKYAIETLKGIPVALAAPSVVTVYDCALDLKDCLVIGISQSGKAEDVRLFLDSAKTQGAITMALTNNLESPLAREANFHLFCAAGEEKSVAATKTFTTQMAAILYFVSEWANHATMKKEILLLAGGIEETIEMNKNIADHVDRYRFMNECFVLARGINYAASMETALKIQETCYVRAKAYATSDFYHGPFAMIDRDMPVIMFLPEGQAYSNAYDMAFKIIEAGADLMVVSNLDDALALGNVGVRIAETSSDYVSPFFNVAVAQMFACQLSLAKGLNPDSPRSLNKVTITI